MVAHEMNDVVIVLPGIMGSVLEKDGRPLWKPSLNALARAFQREALVRSLSLSGDDHTRDDLGDGVVATTVMPDVRIIPGFWKIEGYRDFLDHLKRVFAVIEGDPANPTPDANLFPFPYDWRRDNRVAAGRLKKLIDAHLPRWQERTGNSDAKVILIGHSMGGLVSRYYLEVLGGWEHCRALITLGTPHRGSLKALDTVCNGLSLLSWIDVSSVLRSFTSVYQLLPVYPVLERDGGSHLVINTPGLANLDMVRAMQARAEFHERMASAAREREGLGYGAAYRNFPIVGIQQDTLQSASIAADRVVLSYHRPNGLVERNVSSFGDNTVPFYAALPVEAAQAQPFFVPHGHGALQNSPRVREQIDQYLQLLQVSPEALDGISFNLDQPGLRLQIADAYSTQGGSIQVQAVGVDPGGLTMRLVALDDPAQAEEQHVMRREGEQWVFDLEHPRPGAYRVSVEAEAKHLSVLQDLFEVVDVPPSAEWPLLAKPPREPEAELVDTPVIPASAAVQPDRWQALLTEMRAIQQRLDYVLIELTALAPAAQSQVISTISETPPATIPSDTPSPAGTLPSPTNADADASVDVSGIRRPPLFAADSGLSFNADGASFRFHFHREGNTDTSELLPVNGIDLTTGKYLLELDVGVAGAAAGGAPDDNELTSLHKHKQATATGAFLGTIDGIDQEELTASRWALVVSATENPAVLMALTPLIQHRAAQQGITLNPEHLRFQDYRTCSEWYYAVTNGKSHRAEWERLPPVLIYRPGESVNRWLARHDTSQGPVDPQRGVPFYLALVGRPGPITPGDQAYIPFEFQYELDLYWGVGRICFTDFSGGHQLGAYMDYAERLVDLEQRPDAVDRVGREIVYFGTKHTGDQATTLSATQLLTPLHTWHGENQQRSTSGVAGYERRLLLEDSATRTNLERVLRGADTGKPPAVLFTATHGAGLPLGHPDLLLHQGALVCQEWSGGTPAREHWFAGSDLGPWARVEGMVAVIFACFGGGSPAEDQFLFDEGSARPQVAPFPFVAQLPQQLLLNGALAVLSHIDRAWSYSFANFETPKQSQNYEDLLSRIGHGKRLGSATDVFNIMQGSRALSLAKELEDMKFGKRVLPVYLALLWMARNDARNFALLGDPAVRLPFA